VVAQREECKLVVKLTTVEVYVGEYVKPDDIEFSGWKQDGDKVSGIMEYKQGPKNIRVEACDKDNVSLKSYPVRSTSLANGVKKAFTLTLPRGPRIKSSLFSSGGLKKTSGQAKDGDDCTPVKEENHGNVFPSFPDVHLEVFCVVA